MFERGGRVGLSSHNPKSPADLAPMLAPLNVRVLNPKFIVG